MEDNPKAIALATGDGEIHLTTMLRFREKDTLADVLSKVRNKCNSGGVRIRVECDTETGRYRISRVNCKYNAELQSINNVSDRTSLAGVKQMLSWASIKDVRRLWFGCESLPFLI